jgi:hypothetical protein
MRKSVMAQNAILQKRNTYLENKVIELELQIMKLNSSLSSSVPLVPLAPLVPLVPLVPLAPLVKHDKGTNDDVETKCTTYDIGSIGSDYIKIDMDDVNINNEIKIKKLEEDIKNIIDDRIKLLTVIDTITKENRTMYRHIQNGSKSWFNRIFN